MPSAGPTHEVEYPFPLTDLDRHILSLTDEEYIYHDWEDLKNLISRPPPCNPLARIPSVIYIYPIPTLTNRAASSADVQLPTSSNS
jgi:hypothetical protein